jgi:arsenite transporter
MKRQSLEKYQVFIYLASIGFGLIFGGAFPEGAPPLEAAIWPILGLLLYATFTQVPLLHLREAFADVRFAGAAVIGNFLLVPIVVWGLVAFLPDNPPLRLGVLLVLLVPCTDWFITFTHLGGGDARRAISFAPLSLLLQMALLPVYLWAFLGQDFSIAVARSEMLVAFAGLILLPLFAAFLTQEWVARRKARDDLLDRLAWLPVPLLALVVFSIAATQVGLVAASVGLLGRLLAVFAAFLFLAALMARILARSFGLPPSQGRVLAFSLGTRNSFVVLPLALALPSSFELAVVSVVFQSLVELLGMALFLWLVPNLLFPMPPAVKH